MASINFTVHLEYDEVVERLKAEGWVIPVRCKDCKWYQEGELLAPNKFCFRLTDKDGKRVGYNFADDDFCSCGERKDGADDETL